MTTALQIINGATEKLGVKTAESPLEAADFQVTLDEMNDMLSEWADAGLTPSFIEVSNGSDVVNVDRNAVGAVKDALALRIAPSFQRLVTPMLAAMARLSMTRLEASTDFIGEVEYPDTMPTGSGNDCSNTAINRRFFKQNKKETF